MSHICGNAKRYVSSDVVRMEADRKRRHGNPVLASTEDIETEGEKQLKTLLQKQLDTNVSLQEQLKNRKEFSKAVKHKPVVESLSGVLDLSAYRQIEETDAYIQGLKQCGLTGEEIRQQLHGDDDGRKGIRMEPTAFQKMSKEINRKIKEKHDELAMPDKVTGSRQISRHEMDLEKTINKKTQQSEFLSNVLTSRKTVTSAETIHPDHPMNHVTDILKNLESSVYRKNRRKRKRNFALDSYGPFQRNSYDNETGLAMQEPLTLASEEDLNEGEETLEEKTVSGDEKQNAEIQTKTTQASDFQEKCNKTVIWPTQERHHESQIADSINLQRLSAKIDPIPEDVIVKYRLEESDIRQIPRFHNYSRGEPNKVLFLKNLAPKVTQEDLVALFSRFQTEGGPNIIYRLLSGRMRGQAFVTFDSCETAGRALELVNGYQFKGKPVVIQFGKK